MTQPKTRIDDPNKGIDSEYARRCMERFSPELVEKARDRIVDGEKPADFFGIVAEDDKMIVATIINRHEYENDPDLAGNQFHTWVVEQLAIEVPPGFFRVVFMLEEGMWTGILRLKKVPDVEVLPKGQLN